METRYDEIGVYAAMSTLRAVRRLRPDPIPDAVLERVLEAASWAPTGGNVQPWRVIAVRDREHGAAARRALLRRAGSPTRSSTWRSSRARPRRCARSTERMLDAGNYLAEHFAETPVVLVFCFNPKLMAITDLEAGPRLGGRAARRSTRRSRTHCSRAARRGSAACSPRCSARWSPRCARCSRSRSRGRTAAAVPIGYPLRRGHGPISRRPVAKLAFADRWDVPWGGGIAAMYFADEPEHIAILRDTLRRFVAAEMPPDAVRRWDREHRFPREVFAKLAALGVCGLTSTRSTAGRGATWSPRSR